LWATVARTFKPLRHSRNPTRPRAAEEAHRAKDDHPQANAHSANDHAVNPQSARKKIASPATPARHVPGPPRPLPQPGGIARREKQALARGRAAIEGRIDLHGMTQTEAHAALLRFLHRSQAHGAKFVLVITGKGAALASHGGGILRRQVPLWLVLPEFRACVIGFDAADAGHGGDGALFVRLRKSRG